MACSKRERTGCCKHYQCPHSDKTDHGYDCVEVVGDFCEVGEGCYQPCELSWAADDTETAAKAKRAWGEVYPSVGLSPAIWLSLPGFGP